MAKKKGKNSAPKWLRGLTPKERAEEIAYIERSIKLARKYSKDFGSESGYSLKNIAGIHHSRLAKVRRVSRFIRQLESMPHKVVTPKSKKDFSVYRKFTRQKFPGQKSFFIHTESPAKSKVDIHKGTVRIRHSIKGKHAFTERFFHLPRAAVSIDDLVEMVEEMLPRMPDGEYIAYNYRYGFIGQAASKSLLIGMIQDDWLQYQTKDEEDLEREGLRADPFAKTIVGFRWIGLGKEAREWEREARRERELYRAASMTRQRRERAALEKKLTKRARLTGRR